MMNFKETDTEELKAMRDAINAELKSREAKPQKVIYLHDCAEATEYHLGKYKHYSKLVRRIDVEQKNGYAFIGDFLGVSDEHLIPSGSVVVERCDNDVTAYRVTGDRAKEQLAKCDARRMIDFIRKLAEIVNQ